MHSAPSDIFEAMQLMRFRQLRALLVLHEAGSIASAAGMMSISQPALTKMLREIEAMVGQQLFVRSSRGIRPTLSGELMVKHARRLLAVLRETASQMHAIDDGSEGRVVVGAMLTASSILLPAAIKRLKARFPNVTVSVLEGINEQHLPGLMVGDIDMIIGRVPEANHHDQLLQEPLFDEFIQVFARQGHPLARKPEIVSADLADQAWILPLPETALRWTIIDWFQREKLPLPVNIVESVSLLTVRALLLQSDRITALPHHILDLERRAGLVMSLPFHFSGTSSRVGVLARREADLSPAAAEFLDCIRIEAQELKQIRLDSGRAQ